MLDLENTPDGLQKVEAFVHYTYKKSEGNLMVLDIQMIGNVLRDPEIATGYKIIYKYIYIYIYIYLYIICIIYIYI